MKLVRTFLVLLVAGLLFASCGTDEEDEQARQDAEAELEDLRADLDKAEGEFADGQYCENELASLLRALGDLDSLLEVGLSYDEYSNNVQQISIAYNRINYKGLDYDCLGDVGIPSENAFRAYAEAEDVWGDCISDFDCDSDSIDPQLQDQWAKASKNLAEAQRSARSMGSDLQREVSEIESQIDETESQLASSE